MPQEIARWWKIDKGNKTLGIQARIWLIHYISPVLWKPNAPTANPRHVWMKPYFVLCRYPFWRCNKSAPVEIWMSCRTLNAGAYRSDDILIHTVCVFLYILTVIVAALYVRDRDDEIRRAKVLSDNLEFQMSMDSGASAPLILICVRIRRKQPQTLLILTRATTSQIWRPAPWSLFPT